ncbi:PfkB family carbohydrate kinase [bacterium]|nr:PfkB family carbohydrate kinase [bacterium]
MTQKKDILITGSIALDNIKTPCGEVYEVLGGSATYSSFAASFFSPVKVIGKIGTDFPQDYIQKFTAKKIDVSGLKISNSKTFRWSGLYEGDMEQAKTLSVCPEHLQDLHLDIPSHYQNVECLFLANTDPEIQHSILDSINVSGPILIDTMNLWITKKPDSLKKLIQNIDIMLINETEARLFSGKDHLVSAAREISKMGPSAVIIKKGANGALLFENENLFSVPAYPVEQLKDPTGAGDSFAGGLTGYIASSNNINNNVLRKATIVGSAVASFTVEDFSTNKLESISINDIECRVEKLKQMLKF